jgi:hypothetical protein
VCRGCRKCSSRAYPGAYPKIGSFAARFYGVVDDRLEKAIELFVERREAERVVENWNCDEPDRAGELYVAPVELDTSPN